MYAYHRTLEELVKELAEIMGKDNEVKYSENKKSKK